MKSGYRLMWMIVMFDLPVVRKIDRDAANQFRRYLLDEAFEMSQFSVYLRFCTSHSQFQALAARIQKNLPPGGKVDILQMTDKQFARTINFRGRQRSSEINLPPPQFQLF